MKWLLIFLLSLNLYSFEIFSISSRMTGEQVYDILGKRGFKSYTLKPIWTNSSNLEKINRNLNFHDKGYSISLDLYFYKIKDKYYLYQIYGRIQSKDKEILETLKKKLINKIENDCGKKVEISKNKNMNFLTRLIAGNSFFQTYIAECKNDKNYYQVKQMKISKDIVSFHIKDIQFEKFIKNKEKQIAKSIKNKSIF